MENFSQKEFKAALVAALPSVWRFAMSLSGSKDLADDLSQKTCLRALERRDQVYDASGINRWLLTICRSIWYNDLRAQALRKTQSLTTSDGHELAADLLPIETNIFAREMFTKVMGMPDAHRSVVVLVLVEGYSYRECAEILGIPIGTVMSRLSSARAKLGAFETGRAEDAQQKGRR